MEEFQVLFSECSQTEQPPNKSSNFSLVESIWKLESYGLTVFILNYKVTSVGDSELSWGAFIITIFEESEELSILPSLATCIATMLADVVS